MSMSPNRFVDAMDPTRFIKVLGAAPQNERQLLCAVYFQASKGKDKVYHGQVSLSAHLFGDYEKSQRIGFLPV